MYLALSTFAGQRVTSCFDSPLPRVRLAPYPLAIYVDHPAIVPAVGLVSLDIAIPIAIAIALWIALVSGSLEAVGTVSWSPMSHRGAD